MSVLDLLRRGLERIEAAEPRSGEDASLRIEDERLGHAEELRQGSAEAQVLLAGSDDTYGQADDGVIGALARARAALGQVSANDPALADLERRLTEVAHLVGDLASDLSGYVADVDLDPGRLTWVQQRRAELSELTRSYLGGGGRGIDLMIYGGLIVVVALARPAGLISLLGVRSQAGGADIPAKDADARAA